MNSSINSLTIFFPMYNEAGNIDMLIEQVEAVLPRLDIPEIEILFLDGGSRDGSDETVAAWSEKNPSVRLVRDPPDMSYALAIRTGYSLARGDAVFYTDSDLPIDLSDILRALPLLASADLVIGYRIERKETLKRALFSLFYNRMMRILFRVPVRDVNFSFKLVSREIFNCIRLDATTGFIDGQLLAEARRCGYHIIEIPVHYIPRHSGVSRFDRLSTALKIFREMVGYRLGRRCDDR